MQEKMTVEEYKKLVSKKKNKYHAQKTEYSGIKYDSKLEAGRAAELDVMKKAGLIIGWTRQTPFYLGIMENKYVVDFLVFDLDGKAYAEEIKGKETPQFKKNRKLWAIYGPCPLIVIYKDRKETIIPKKGD